MTTEIKGGLLAQGSDSEAARALRAGRARIERGWCQDHSAVDVAGHYVHWDEAAAVRWCVYGAIAYHSAASEALRAVLTSTALGQWNDKPGRTQAEVLAAFDRAIALASNASDPKGPPSPSSPALDPQETK